MSEMGNWCRWPRLGCRRVAPVASIEAHPRGGTAHEAPASKLTLRSWLLVPDAK